MELHWRLFFQALNRTNLGIRWLLRLTPIQFPAILLFDGCGAYTGTYPKVRLPTLVFDSHTDSRSVSFLLVSAFTAASWTRTARVLPLGVS